MNKLLILGLATTLVMPVAAKRAPKPVEVDSLGRKIKTGWNFGVLPSVAFDADYGFQGGLLGNIYYYGDGKQYPEYIHSIYVEGAYTTKHHGIFRVNYDSKYLIPNHRLTLDATYIPDAMCDFFGFNGYQSLYNKDWSRGTYKFKRDLIRVAADIEGPFTKQQTSRTKNLKWNVGLGVLGYLVNDRPDSAAVDSKTLYERYQDWGLISQDETKGGWHPYARVGITFDTRDKRQGPNKGIWTDAFFTYNAAFNASYGQQAKAGFNNLQFNFTFRHYVSCFVDKKGVQRVTFAYRLGTQNLIIGKTPFYMNNYLNTLFIQRVLYEGLGGGNSIRGMMCNRILAKGIAYANVEFRFRVVNFDIKHQHFYIGLNPFFDLGMVTQPYEISDELIAAHPEYFSQNKSDIYRPHMTAGVGLKIGMNENFVLSADWAMPVNDKNYMNQDNNKIANFYVKMGYLF